MKGDDSQRMRYRMSAASLDLPDLQTTVDTMRWVRAKMINKHGRFDRRADERLLIYAAVLRERTDQQKRTARNEALRAIRKDG